MYDTLSATANSGNWSSTFSVKVTCFLSVQITNRGGIAGQPSSSRRTKAKPMTPYRTSRRPSSLSISRERKVCLRGKRSQSCWPGRLLQNNLYVLEALSRHLSGKVITGLIQTTRIGINGLKLQLALNFSKINRKTLTQALSEWAKTWHFGWAISRQFRISKALTYAVFKTGTRYGSKASSCVCKTSSSRRSKLCCQSGTTRLRSKINQRESLLVCTRKTSV